MIKRFEHNHLTWIDVINPTTEEIREIVRECKLPLNFTNDLTTMTPRSEVFAEKNFLKVTLNFPIVRRTDITHPHEVKFIATKTHFITIHFEDIEAIHKFSQEFEVSGMITQTKKSASGAHICMSLLSHMYKNMTVKLDYLETRMNDIEEQIFNGKEREMVIELSSLSRRLIMFRQTLYSHDLALSELGEKAVLAFGKGFNESVELLKDEYTHQNTRLAVVMVMLDELRATNNSLLTTKQNEIMKTLTILAFITFPLTLFTSTFGMNTENTPILGLEGDFWIIVGVMFIVSVSFFSFFKYKKWM
jgi:magnesium transporter